MQITDHVRLVMYDERFLNSSSVWLRDPEIQRLTMTPPFTDEQQQEWFKGLSGRTDYVVWGIELQGKPIGALGLKNIRPQSAEYWGYIGNKHLWGKGIGRWMMQVAMERARERDIEQLELRVLRTNERAIRLYRSCGFTERTNLNPDDDTIWMERSLL